MTSRVVNLAIFCDTLLLLGSGILLLETNRSGDAWLFTLHRYTGAVLLVLLVPKTRIIWRALARRVRRNTWLDLTTLVSVALTILLAIVLALALAWTLDWLPFYLHVVLDVTPLGLHWYLAFPLIPFFAWHAYKRWPRSRRTTPDAPPALVPGVSRRTALSLLSVGVLGLVGFAALEEWAGLTEWMRRFTGSRLVNSFQPGDFPVTNSDVPPDIDLASWRLQLTGRVAHPLALSYAEIGQLPLTTHTATVDCTLGWASTQEWRGVALADLLARAGAADDFHELTCRAVTGYYVVLTPEEAREALLATHVGSNPLAEAHGFPARLVIPSQRGFHWIKWLGDINVS